MKKSRFKPAFFHLTLIGIDKTLPVLWRTKELRRAAGFFFKRACEPVNIGHLPFFSWRFERAFIEINEIHLTAFIEQNIV
ncbi:hypothetical protein AC626_11400, partial [Pseudoalteromonas rubra]